MFRYVALFVFLLTGCSSVSEVFYVDSDFSADEQAQIQQAADAWEGATSGQVHFDLVFGVPVDPTYGSAWGRRVIARVSQAEIDRNTEILGIVDGAIGVDLRNEEKYELIALVPPRLYAFSLRQILMHELGHHLGMEHIQNETALMAGCPGLDKCGVFAQPAADSYVTHQCIGRADVIELRRVNSDIDIGQVRMCL